MTRFSLLVATALSLAACGQEPPVLPGDDAAVDARDAVTDTANDLADDRTSPPDVTDVTDAGDVADASDASDVSALDATDGALDATDGALDAIDASALDAVTGDALPAVDLGPDVLRDVPVPEDVLRACVTQSACDPVARGCGDREVCFNGACRVPASCAELRDQRRALPTGVYTLDEDGAPGGNTFAAWCDMDFDGGGWTLVLKVDGAANDLAYNASLWTNGTLRPDSVNLNRESALLRAYSTVRVRQFWLALSTARMAPEGGDVLATVPRVVATRPSTSACETPRGVFAGSTFDSVTPAVSEWAAAVPGARFDSACTRVGVNAESAAGARVRLGALARRADGCPYDNAWLGLGGLAAPCTDGGAAPVVSAGWVGPCNADGTRSAQPAFAWLFVR